MIDFEFCIIYGVIETPESKVYPAWLMLMVKLSLLFNVRIYL